MSNTIEINKDYEVKCVSYSHEGLGVCKIDNFVVFVHKMLVGEKGIVRIKQIKDSFARGVLVSLNSKSEARIKSDCEHYNMCGGCSLRHMDSMEQNKFKSNLVKQNLYKYGKIDIDKITVSNTHKNDYRNKASFVVGKLKNRLILGFYKKNTHEIIEIDNCRINDDMDKYKQFIQNVLNETKQEVFNEITNTGNLKHVIIRKSNIGEIQITFVSKEDKLNNQQKLIDKLSDKIENLKSIILNVKRQNTNTILSKKEIVLFGDAFIIDEINGKKFQIGSQSFYQVNHDVMKDIYDFAIDNLELNINDSVIDAYCGIGTISILMADKVKSVFGIELNEQSIEYAKKNLKMNKIKNTKFISGYVEDVVNEMSINANKIVVDPARKGCDRKFLEFIGNSNIDTISYISCNSATLARDIKILSEEYGFKIKKIKAFDMFANTYHVETVATLTRNN